MTTRTVFENKDIVVSEDEDTTGLALGFLATHVKEYEATDKETAAVAKGDSVGEATANLREGQEEGQEEE